MIEREDRREYLLVEVMERSKREKEENKECG